MTNQIANGQNIRLASWTNSVAKVGVVYGEDRARAQRNGHDIAYAVYAGSALVGGPERHAYYAARRAEFEAATVVAHDEIVTIGDETFRVHVNRGNDGEFPRNCDPIRLIPVAA